MMAPWLLHGIAAAETHTYPRRLFIYAMASTGLLPVLPRMELLYVPIFAVASADIAFSKDVASRSWERDNIVASQKCR
jgi:hypothetical protein